MKRTLLTLCVAALLVTAGCSALTDDGPSDADADQPTDDGPSDADTDQRKSGAIDAIQDVDTYRMAMETSIRLNGQTVTISQAGVFDHEAKKARLNVTARGAETVAYVDGATRYVKARGRWQTQNPPGDDVGAAGNALTQQRNVLESGDVSISGTATVDGVETTVLSVDPNETELKELLSPRQPHDFGDTTIENATYRLYVADDTDRPQKLSVTMEMRVDGQIANAEVTATFSAYGDSVDITIPDAATQLGGSADRATASNLAAV